MAGLLNRVNSHVHLIGIGGIGMSSIAQLLLRRGVRVSGSDLKEGRVVDELRKLGASVFIGHSPANIKGADLIVYSSAIKQDNCEIIEAAHRNIPAIRRAEVLAWLMEAKSVITVTGSHGKTTTTSLISYLLLQAGLCPTVAIGGILRNIDTNACIGEGDFFVAEADESDASLLHYEPRYSVITNIDYEHLDYYKNFKNLLNTFREFLNKTRHDGCVFACADDGNLRIILRDYKARFITFGFDALANICPKNITTNGLSSEFDCFYDNRFIDRFRLSLGGLHNVSNALAVIAVGLELGIDLKFIRRALLEYKGAKRRLEIKLEGEYLVIDDYAHHPTEIKATLAAIRNLKANRVVAIFQPHRYTRTKLLLEEFAGSFEAADCVIVTDIYAASEAPLEGLTGRSIYDRLKYHTPGKEAYFLAKEEIVPRILEIIKPGDLVVTLGAGDICKVSDDLVQGLNLLKGVGFKV